MIVKIKGYNGLYRVVSIALDEVTKEDLEKDAIDFLHITDNSIILYPDNTILSENLNDIELLKKANNYDVYELYEDGRLVEYYDDSSIDNYFFVTAKCNSNCIMCPSPDIARKNGNNTAVDNLIELAKHIPTDTKHLTVTGGEPFLVGEDLFRFIDYLKNKFEETEFLFLTNGRVFAIDSYVQKLVEVIPNYSIVAIPIHGSTETIHDSISQAKNSFVQTKRGIRALLKNKIRVELRIVVSRLNVDDLDNIAKLITDEFPRIEYVSIMAMEMTGSARVNKDLVWIPYSRAGEGIENAVFTLLKSGIDVKLYNFPLCSVRKEFWPLCEKSISPDKVRYSDECDICKMRKSCGGIFAGTISIEKDELKAIV